jgi:DNA polymerase-3 subunit alpha
MSGFVHLRVHTEFSLVDSVVRIPKLMAATAAGGMPAVALTDQSNMFALIKFYRAAVKNGVKPVIGVDAWVANAEGELSPLVLLAQDTEGYLNLSQLVSRSYQEGQTHERAIVHHEWLAGNTKGIIALSGGRFGDVGRALLAENTNAAKDYLAQWQKLFKSGFYLELQRTGRDTEEAYNQAAIQLAGAENCPLVATNDVRFLRQKEFDAHEIRVCIHQGHEVTSTRRPRIFSQQQYLRTADEMAELFKDIPQALENTVEIAKRCNLTINLGDSMLPDFPVPEGMTESDHLRTLSEEGLEWRLNHLYDTSAADFAETRKEYDARLKRELDVIIQMEFPGYFLIVSDFIKWSRDNDVPVGPGRGSGAGSLVAYALGITDVDPLAYDLLFERFLNPERVSMPDFDIDFCMDKRDSVIQYVSEKYGSDKVSQIITYGTMAAKAVVRDVARVMGHPYGFGDRLAKMVPMDLGITLTKALEAAEDMRHAYNNEEDTKAVVDMALQLEGLSRNAGKHAGGVVIAPTRLTDFTPLYCEADGSSLVTQFDKDDAEAVGLVKFDFLGLRTLTIIENAVTMINSKRGKDEQLNLDKLTFDDGQTYRLLQEAKTTGVFQLESGGMKKLIAQLKPDCFDDIVALVALYRPGPMSSGMLDDFIARKNGQAPVSFPHPDYQHDSLKPILQSTYGVIVYQEQVMQIGQVLAGYSLGGADVLRRAMGKKKPEEMAKQRQVFLDGCKENSIDLDLASNIFDLVEKFAGYGFNKSHSVAYAVLSYQTAWLKRHHPAEFFSAVLSADMDSTDKVVKTIEDLKDTGLKLLPPDINHSFTGFTPTSDGNVRFGLGAIKGVGEGVLEKIFAEREANGKYKNLFDLCQRVDSSQMGRSVVECLIKAGALDCLRENRATLTDNLSVALSAAQQKARDSDSGQFDMFGELVASDENETELLTAVPEWPKHELLAEEKKTTGMYFSGHPIDPHAHELAKITSGRLVDQCARVPAGDDSKGGWGNKGVDAVIAGLITDIRVRATNRGSKILTATLDDKTAKVDVMVAGELLEASGSIIQSDTIIVVEGGLSIDSFSGGHMIRARQIYNLEEARERFARLLLVKWVGSGSLQNIHRALVDHRGAGRLPVYIDYSNNAASARIRLGDDWQIAPSMQLIEALSQTEGVSEVDVVY